MQFLFRLNNQAINIYNNKARILGSSRGILIRITIFLSLTQLFTKDFTVYTHFCEGITILIFPHAWSIFLGWLIIWYTYFSSAAVLFECN